MKRSSLTLTFLLLTTSLVQAESEAEKAFQAMFDDINKSGIFTMDVGSTHYNADTDILTAQNVVIKGDFKLPVPDDEKKEGSDAEGVKIRVEFNMASMVSNGLELKDDGIEYQSIKYEGFGGNFAIDAPEEANDTTIEFALDGPAEVINGFSPFMGEFKIAPSRPIGSVMDYIRPLLFKARYEEYKSASGQITQSNSAGDVFEKTEMGPMTVSNLSNGRVGSYIVDYQRGETNLKAQIAAEMKEPEQKADADALSNVPELITYEVGKTVYEGYDFGALWSAIDPNAPPLTEEKTLLEEASVRDISISAPGLFTASIGSSLTKGVKIKNSASSLVPAFDKLIAEGKDPEDLPEAEQQALIKTGFDLFRGLSMSLSNIRDIKGEVNVPEGPFKGQTATFGMEKIEMLDLNSDGIKEYSLSGLSYDGPPSINFALDRFAVENLEFPSYAAIEKAIKDGMANKEPKPAEVAQLMPNALTLVVEGLSYSDDMSNKVSANEIRTELNRKGLAVPAYLTTKLDDVVLSKSMIKHPLAGVLMQQLGLEELTLNEEITLNWDEASESLKLDPFNIEIGSVAQLTGAIGFGGIKRPYMEDPEQAQAAMATGTVLPSTLALNDRGGINELINLAGGMTGMGPDQFRVFAESQAQAMLSGFTKPDFARAVAEQVKIFLNDPKSLTIALTPAAPVPVMQVIGAATTAPDAIPDILSIGVVANGN